jgi:hypothetical protein
LALVPLISVFGSIGGRRFLKRSGKPPRADERLKAALAAIKRYVKEKRGQKGLKRPEKAEA